MKKTKLVALLMMLMMLASTSVAFADSNLISASSTSFKKSWTLNKTASANKHRLTYGYDTFLINEDFANANSIGYIHKSKIVNGKGTFCGPKKTANDGWSDKEVKHKGSTVKYYCVKVN